MHPTPARPAPKAPPASTPTFSHPGIRRGPAGFTASAAATDAWANRPGHRWPCSTIAGHRVFLGLDRNGDLVDLKVDGRDSDPETGFYGTRRDPIEIDSHELRAFQDDVMGKEA